MLEPFVCLLNRHMPLGNYLNLQEIIIFQPTATYDVSKTYFAPAAVPAAATAVYSVAESPFNTGNIIY